MNISYTDKTVVLPLPDSIAGLLKLKMLDLNMNQRQLAAFLDVDDAPLSKYVRGERQVTLEFLYKMRDKLGIDGDYLIACSNNLKTSNKKK